MKRKLGAETTSMTGGDGPREAVRGVQSSKHQHIVQPYNTDLEDFLKKLSKDAGNPSLGGICDYCGVTSKHMLKYLDKQDCQHFLAMGTYTFGKSCEFNHRTATKQHVNTIK